jgi:uncharacterized OB-fold protein
VSTTPYSHRGPVDALPQRVLPTVDADNRPFWASCARHRMELQQCPNCRHWRYYPSPVCPECSVLGGDWRPVGGYGTLFTYSVLHRPPSSFWAQKVPYTYGVVELDEGPMMPTNVVGIDPAEVRIGMRLRVTYEDVAADLALPHFEPIGAAR